MYFMFSSRFVWRLGVASKNFFRKNWMCEGAQPERRDPSQVNRLAMTGYDWFSLGVRLFKMPHALLLKNMLLVYALQQTTEPWCFSFSPEPRHRLQGPPGTSVTGTRQSQRMRPVPNC